MLLINILMRTKVARVNTILRAGVLMRERKQQQQFLESGIAREHRLAGYRGAPAQNRIFDHDRRNWHKS
jgi:hypothetical protein